MAVLNRESWAASCVNASNKLDSTQGALKYREVFFVFYGDVRLGHF